MLVKVSLGGDLRRVRVGDTSIDTLRSAVGASFGGALSGHVAAASGVENVGFQYDDEDGDEITVSTQLDWEEAVRLSGVTGGTLRLRIATPPAPLPVAVEFEAAPEYAHSDGAVPPPAVPPAAVGVGARTDVDVDVHPGLRALAGIVTDDVCRVEGMSRNDIVDMVRVMWAMGISPRVLVKLGAVLVPDFRAWKKRYFFRGALLDGTSPRPARRVEAVRVVAGGAVGASADAPAPGGGGDGGYGRPAGPGRHHEARFVEHVTYDDESEPVAPGHTFTKVWRVMNDSDKPWPKHIAMVPAGGDTVHVAATTGPLRGLPAGETAEVVASVTAPDTAGRYRGVWRLQDASTGRTFGERLWTTVQVADGGAGGTGSDGDGGAGEVPPLLAGASGEGDGWDSPGGGGGSSAEPPALS